MAFKRKFKKALKRYNQKKRIQGKINTIMKRLTAMKPEVKWAEYQDAAATADYNGKIVTFSTALAQGLGDFNARIGDQITMKGLRLRLTPNTYSYNFAVAYRIVIFQLLKDPDGAISQVSIPNLLMHSTQMGTVFAPVAPYDHDNRSSFKVWYDKSFTFAPQTLTSTNVNPGQTRIHKINIKFPEGSKFSKVTYYNAGTTTTKNELFMLVLTDSSATVSFPYLAHLYYTDS